jgi:hypothetical protein
MRPPHRATELSLPILRQRREAAAGNFFDPALDRKMRSPSRGSRVSFVKINEQPGIRCASPRFGNQHGTKIYVNDSLHWSDEARDFTQIITGPTSDI